MKKSEKPLNKNEKIVNEKSDTKYDEYSKSRDLLFKYTDLLIKKYSNHFELLSTDSDYTFEFFISFYDIQECMKEAYDEILEELYPKQK